MKYLWFKSKNEFYEYFINIVIALFSFFLIQPFIYNIALDLPYNHQLSDQDRTPWNFLLLIYICFYQWGASSKKKFILYEIGLVLVSILAAYLSAIF